MTVCLDTNVFLQIFGRNQPYHSILRALLDRRLTLAVSTEILLEYEEVTSKLSGADRWQDVATLLDLLSQLHNNIRQVGPQYRFNVITADPDDNKFSDCAIAAEADFVVTDDSHFSPLSSAGYKPQPITPNEFIRRLALTELNE
jgi:putative PIN family toxin of toxin-antitoxin system